jgi:peptidoglycan hydrolase CwlO-like protein
MQNEINALDKKIEILGSLCRELRAQNLSLRQKLILSETEIRSLNDRISLATKKLEDLVESEHGGSNG